LRRSSLACALAAFALAAGEADARDVTVPVGPLEPKGRWLQDQTGRVVIVHGLQVAHKKPPYHPPPRSFRSRDARAIARWGFNGVMLAWFWKGLEPERGAYDRSYAAEIAREGRILARRGVMVQLEVHQDQYNERVYGAGFPDWATLTDGVPVQPEAGGVMNALGPAQQRAFDNLYANRDGIGDAFADAWKVMARTFRSHRPQLGYDLYNEPYPGTQMASCAQPAGCPAFDRLSLQPLLDKLAAGVREVDRRPMVWYEPMFLFGAGADNHFAPPPDSSGPAGFAFHSYCLSAIATGQPDRESEAPGYPACPRLDERVFDNAEAAARAMGVPPLFNEFGDTQDLANIRRVIELAERHMTGWKSYGFDADTRRFSFAYRPEPRVEAPTAVFTAPLQYPDGYRARVRGARIVSRPGAPKMLLHNRPGARRVTVRLVPRGSGRPRTDVRSDG
jgi:endoglycosylceramidase